MTILKRLATVAAVALSAPGLAAPGQGNADQMWRLDCGKVFVNDLNAFSDTQSYTGRSLELADSCYLIRHGTKYLLWDTGLPVALKGAPNDKTLPMSATVTRTIAEQLAAIGVKQEQITLVGISHYHFDHVGQAPAFPNAKLLIGKGDLDVLKAEPARAVPLAAWITGKGVVEGVSGDKDIFGDGSVTMIDLPGHTPGHHGLLVRLARTGPVLLSGDVAHFRENLDTVGVPPFNANRADSIAAMDRYRRLGASLKATVIIQHEPADVGKLPAFPAAAD